MVVMGVWSAHTGLIPGTQGGDGKAYYMPGRAFSASMLRSGSLPEWNPYIYTGYPHIADIQNGFFYPPNLALYALFSPGTAYSLSIAFNVFLIAFFISRFLRPFLKSTHAVWIGSATFALAGFLCYNAVTVTIPDSAAWIPAFFWCLEKWIRTGRWRYCAWGGVCLVMELFAGWPQMVLLTAIYAGIYLLISFRRHPGMFRIFAGLAVMGLLAAGLGLPQLLATLQLKNQTILEHLSYPEYVFASVAPQLVILLFYPFLTGAGVPDGHWHRVAYYAPISCQVNVYYVGVLPLMLALAAFLLWRQSRLVRYGVTSLLVSLLLAWGGYTPLGQVLYRLPVYNFFHDHRINLIFFDFAVAILAACSVDALEFANLSEEARRRLAWLLPLAVIAVAALLLIRARALMQSLDPAVGAMENGWLLGLHQTMRFNNPDVMLPIFVLFAAGILFYFWVRHPRSRALAVLAVVFVIADLAYYGIGGWWFATSTRASSDEQAALRMMQETTDHQDFRSLSLVKWFYPAVSPNFNQEFDHADILGLGPFLPRRHSLLLTSQNVGTVGHWRELLINNTVLSVLNTRFVEVDGLELEEITHIFGPLQTQARANPTTGENDISASPNIANQTIWSSSLNQTTQGPPTSIPPCTRKDCERVWMNLHLDSDSAYELTFRARVNDAAPGLGKPPEPTGMGGGFQKPDGGEYFALTDKTLGGNRDFVLYTHLYLTGPKTGGTSLYLINFSRAPVDLKEVSLRKIGSFPLTRNPYRLAGHYGGLNVLENTEVYPRAFFVSSLQPVSSFSDARSELWRTHGPFDARHRALVEAPADQLPATISEGTVEQLTYSPNRADMEVNCPATCYLVVSDMYYPGWTASIDRQPTTIYLTDAMVRGIVISGGKHHIEFAYHPLPFRFGLLFSLATLGVASLIIVRSRNGNLESEVGYSSHN